MLKKIVIVIALPLALASQVASAAEGRDAVLDYYQSKSPAPMDSASGEMLWNSVHTVDGEQRRCASCHTDDLKASGKYQRTGKHIEPLAVSANPKRLTEKREVGKWLLRNCKWTWGRECTAQEKADLLAFIAKQ